MNSSFSDGRLRKTIENKSDEEIKTLNTAFRFAILRKANHAFRVPSDG